MLAERGVEVDHVSVFRWVQRFTPLFADAARPCRHATGDRWWVDETYIKIAGRWCCLYRAVDQFGQVIDVLACDRRDAGAARRFFTRALRQVPRPDVDESICSPPGGFGYSLGILVALAACFRRRGDGFRAMGGGAASYSDDYRT